MIFRPGFSRKSFPECVAAAASSKDMVETDAAVKELVSEKPKTVAQFVADYENKAADAARKADEAKEAAAKAAARLVRTKLYSPIDGVVQQMAVTTVGQVVTTGQQLLVVAPMGEALQVDALVAKIDIGLVLPRQRGRHQAGRLSVTRFGVLHGEVARIASEAIDPQQAKRALANATAAANAANMSSTSAPGQPAAFVFPVTLALDQDVINTDGRAFTRAWHDSFGRDQDGQPPRHRLSCVADCQSHLRRDARGRASVSAADGRRAGFGQKQNQTAAKGTVRCAIHASLSSTRTRL